MATSSRFIQPSSKPILAICNLGSMSLDVALAIEEQGSLRILAYHGSKNLGFRAGLIVHPQVFAERLLASLEECEKRAQVRATEAHVGLACSGFEIQELEDSSFLGGVIRQTDIRKLLRNFADSASLADTRVISESAVDFAIDGRWGARHPEGLFAHSLAAKMVRQSLERSVVINLARLFDEIRLPLASIANSAEASGHMLLSAEEKEMGGIIIDIGAETCGVVIFHHGIAVVVHYLSIGGSQITQDLARGLALDRKQAEQHKIHHGDVGPDADERLRDFPITRWAGAMTEYDTMSDSQVNHIVKARCREMLNDVAKVLNSARRYSHRAMVCHICGRASDLLGLERLAESVLRMPIRKGWRVHGLGSGIPAVIDGLAMMVTSRSKNAYLGNISIRDHWFMRLRHWLRFQD